MAFISQIKLPSGTTYPLKAPVIPYGTVDSTSTATAFTATVDGITELADGTIMMLHNGVVTSAAGFTININGLGAKKVFNNLTNATQDTTIFNIAYTMIFVYSTALDSGNGGWWCYRGYDSNTNTIGYQLRTNSGNLVASDDGAKYRLWFTSADGQQWVPANTSTSTNATTARSFNTRAIDPFGPIVYNSTNGSVNSGTRPPVGTLWQQYTLTIGYSYVKSLTAWKPVFLKCTPGIDGSAKMKDIVQALPSSDDGYIYIFLGIAYSATAMELRAEHPVYYHDGTGVRVWTGKEIPTVSYSQNVSTGTKIGTITINGTGTDIYAPSAGGGGTVESVAVANATNGGLSISGSPITTSGTISIGHSNVLTSAQTTQAVYPIKIDKNGHISAYGSAVTITDEKLKVIAATNNTQYYPVLSADTTTAETKIYDTGIGYITTSTEALLSLGDASSTGKAGCLTIYGSGTKGVDIYANNSLTKNIEIHFPASDGTLALTSDVTTATLSATDDGAGNVMLSVTGVTSANLNSASGVSF